MPERRQQIAPDEQTEALVRAAADRAAQIALAGAEDAQRIAVERAVRDVNVDRDLREHQQHLTLINGSQEKMAAALSALEKALTKLAEAFERQAAVTSALGSQLTTQSGQRFSRLTIRLGIAGAIAAYGTIIAMILTQN